MSTTDALVKFTTEIASSLDDKQNVAVQALMLDFSKAFDKMLPHIAIQKLLALNTSPSLVRLMMSFFNDRWQRVRYADVYSSYECCKIGVPQGTIMGPLLWNIFVHDLLPEIPCIKYADDTTVYNAVESSEVRIENSTSHKASLIFHDNPLQSAADYAARWCEENSMLLNVTKSQSLTLTLQKNIISDPIKINDMPISQNSSVKLLRVCFDNHM